MKNMIKKAAKKRINDKCKKKIIDYTVNRKKGKDIGIVLTLYTGLRIGEICVLKWGDINFNKNYLVVNKTI